MLSKNTEVYIVTNPELEWYPIVGVYESLEDAKDLVEELGEPHMIHSEIIYKSQ